jgi:integrase
MPRRNADGKHTIRLVANVAGTQVRLSLNVACLPEQWDDARSELKGKSDEARQTNMILARHVAAANEIIRLHELAGTTLTPKAFVREFRNPSSKEDFIAYYQARLHDDYDRRLIGDSTYRDQLNTLSKLRMYMPVVSFSVIGRRWLDEFDRWHVKFLTKAGHEGKGAREKAAKHIAKYLNAAREDGKRFADPFLNFQRVKHTPRTIFLSELEVRSIERLYDEPKLMLEAMERRADRLGMAAHNARQYACASGVMRMQRVAACFLFQVFTGVRFSDLARLTQDNVQEGRLVFRPQKTSEMSGKDVRILLAPHLSRLLVHNRSGVLLPVPSNQKYNEYLKELAEMAGIVKPLTSHVARHTFATLYLSRGGKVEELQHLMGVTKIETVMVYVHITGAALDEGITQAFGAW